MLKNFKTEGTAGVGVLVRLTLLFAAVTALSVFAFAVLAYLLPDLLAYSALLATLAVALGAFAASFYLSSRAGKKGWLCGLAVGAAVFALLTLAALIINHGGFTSNTVFRLVIVLLSSEIGGIIGVGRRDRKYI